MKMLEEEFYRNITNIVQHSPPSHDARGHYRELRTKVSPEFADIISTLREELPEDWERSYSGFIRMILSCGVFALKELMDYRVRHGEIKYNDVDSLNLMFSCWEELNKAKKMLRLIEISRKSKKIGDRIYKKKLTNVISILDRFGKPMQEMLTEEKKRNKKNKQK